MIKVFMKWFIWQKSIAHHLSARGSFRFSKIQVYAASLHRFIPLIFNATFAK